MLEVFAHVFRHLGQDLRRDLVEGDVIAARPRRVEQSLAAEGEDVGLHHLLDVNNDGEHFPVLLRVDAAAEVVGAVAGEFLHGPVVGALDAGGVTANGVEFGAGVDVGEGTLGGVEQFALHAADAVQVPGGVEDALEEFFADGGGGIAFIEELVAELFELGTFLVLDDDFAGVEAVLDGVEARDVLAASVLGPVDFFAFSRLVLICLSVAIVVLLF